MTYKCKKEFWLPMSDDNGFINESEQALVPIGSVWYPDDANIIGGEVHLECMSGCEDLGWIEITATDLSDYFETVKEDAE